MSKTTVWSVASLTTGDVGRRMLENNVDPTTDSVIQGIEEEHEVMEALKGFKAVMQGTKTSVTRERHAELKKIIEDLQSQQHNIKIDLEAGLAHPGEELSEDLGLLHRLGLFEQKSFGLMSFSERITKMAIINLIKLKQEPLTMAPGHINSIPVLLLMTT